MNELKYVKLEELNAEGFKILLNKHRIREHLIEHEMFDLNSLESWIKEKSKVDSTDGCRVRGIISNDSIAGWCGIQYEEGRYEIAIVLDDMYWGIGKRVFIEIMSWARDLGHDEVFIHLLHTRPEYKFLRKISNNVFETEMFGNKFTTYQLSVC